MARRGGTDVGDANNDQLVPHRRKPPNQARFNDGAGTAAHHRQVHHQPEGVPIDQVGGGAVVGAGKVLLLLNPRGAADPEPAARGQGHLLLLHAAQQVDFGPIEVAEFAQAAQVALGHFVPAFATGGGFTGIGAVENRVGGRGRGGKGGLAGPRIGARCRPGGAVRGGSGSGRGAGCRQRC